MQQLSLLANLNKRKCIIQDTFCAQVTGLSQRSCGTPGSVQYAAVGITQQCAVCSSAQHVAVRSSCMPSR